MDPTCCTCASPLSSVPRLSPSEKPYPDHQTQPCCSRVVCGSCLHKNPRFASYCPYCQLSTGPSHLEPRPQDPPAYTVLPRAGAAAKPPTPTSEEPPPYTLGLDRRQPLPAEFDGENEKAGLDTPPEDTLHFLDHDTDTITSLSLRYGVPVDVLRRANGITSDHLLLARTSVIIPGSYYQGGVSLSPRPIEGEEEELRKSKIRRFMTTCKVADYDVALLYIEEADYDLREAVGKYFDDETWERENPVKNGVKGKGKKPAKWKSFFWK